jgi:hypothetical protein
MSSKTPEQKKARALQDRTDWSYSECLRLVREKTPEEIEALIKVRAKPLPVFAKEPAGK